MKKQGSYTEIPKVPTYLYYQSDDFTSFNTLDPVLVAIYDDNVSFRQGEHQIDIDINLIEDFFKCLQKFRKENS